MLHDTFTDEKITSKKLHHQCGSLDIGRTSLSSERGILSFYLLIEKSRM